MKLSFINESIFEPHKNSFEKGNSGFLFLFLLYIYIYKICATQLAKQKTKAATSCLHIKRHEYVH